MKISTVVITNQKNKEVLDVCIKSAIQNSDEVIIVGNVQYLNYPNVRLVDKKELAAKGNIGFMRNIGADIATGEVVVNCDDDIIITPGFKKKVIKYFKSNKDKESFTTKVLGCYGNRYWDRVIFDSKTGESRLLDYDAPYNEQSYYSGAFMVRKKLLTDSFKFDTDLGFYEKEDVEYSAKLKAANKTINFNNEIVVVHWDSSYGTFKHAIHGYLYCDKINKLSSSEDTNNNLVKNDRLAILTTNTYTYYKNL